MIYLRHQRDILRNLRFRMRDTGGNRWEDAEIHFAINSGLRKWAGRVLVPFRYDYGDITGYPITLPSYIDPRYIRPYIEDSAYSYLDVSYLADQDTYQPLPGHTVEVDTSGNRIMRLTSLPYTVDLRIFFWLNNGEVPWDNVDLNATIDADDTSLVVDVTGNDMPYIAECGYVYINDEWMQYRGITRGSSQITLTNLVRGFYGTTAAEQAADSIVYWGIAADRADLFDQLYYHARAELHSLFLTDGSETERSQHEFNMRYFQQMADEFWPGYVSGFQPKINIEIPETL